MSKNISLAKDSCHIGSGNNLLFFNRKNIALEASVSYGKVFAADIYEKKWLKTKAVKIAEIGVSLRTASSDGVEDNFARAYNYPQLSLKCMYGNYSGVKMHKEASVDWGKAEPVNYVSNMGKVFGLYFSFSRPLWKGYIWQVGYDLSSGFAYNTRPYNHENNIDNELTGSHMLIYFGSSLYAQWLVGTQWSLRADMGFRHLSNGALYRPNKGANSISPRLTLAYSFSPVSHFKQAFNIQKKYYPRRLYPSVSFSLGGKSLLEEWLRTQYNLSPQDREYRTENFRIYPSFALQMSYMWRYTEKFASGMGVDLFYGTYASHVQKMDLKSGFHESHSPFSCGVSLNHEAFYGPFSLCMSLGYYLYRQMGHLARIDEKPYYERIGLKYYFGKHYFVSLGVKAHKTKADLSELTIGFHL